jgi:hypothetical protein
MTPSSGMPAELLALFDRYSALGRLLPSPDDFDTEDPIAVAGAKLVLAEMSNVEAEVNRFIASYRQ